MRIILLAVLALVLASCASPPSKINNVCAVLDQRDGFLTNWSRSAQKAERRYGVPRAVLLATIRVESGFDGDARPPRRKLLGIVPWKRKSTALGYSQALNGTWERYQRETGNWRARRTNFDDAIDFVGWYHRLSHTTNGVALNDTYNMYLNYYHGHGGFRRGNPSATAQRAARKAESLAQSYATQLAQCGR
ncbi:transglycosylase SLT domain-containing protein [Pseudohoeflea coraliihabitans]|uniref:Transglycosylase SLT domain-containing protein n=1 Tax=Pseudohoeflea coraliihabitans TaxID=2860393 RepID=A0ABS6WJP4_9HYPH|nr:transglycosylase SLT domain-containing protein [Pseudohoeflea sp. DP4N28-3]MBW3095868.1 transglycosylase SLT domain-containing protein [Pseudohoeflea sp. DP4N28-3]